MLHWAEQWHAHPAIVHFPLALFITAFLFNCLGIIFKKEPLQRTALHMYIAAALFAPLAVQTGLWQEDFRQIHHPVLSLHKTFALLTMWSSLISLPILWLSKKISLKQFKITLCIFTLLMVIFVSSAGFLGGRMVFDYGIGIETEN